MEGKKEAKSHAVVRDDSDESGKVAATLAGQGGIYLSRLRANLSRGQEDFVRVDKDVARPLSLLRGFLQATFTNSRGSFFRGLKLTETLNREEAVLSHK